MHTPTQALLWRQWRMLRWPFAGSIAVALVVALAGRLYSARVISIPYYDGYVAISRSFSGAYWFGLLVLLALVMTSDSSNDGRSLRFPSALLTLPFRATRIVAIEYFTRLAVVAAYALVFAPFFYGISDSGAALFDDFGLNIHVEIPISLAIGLQIAMFAILQAAFWWEPKIRVLLAGVTLAMLLPLGKVIAAACTAHPIAASSLIAFVCVSGGYLLALAAVQRARSGAFYSFSLRSSSAGSPAPTFTSPEEAQRWYEWQTRFRLMPRAALGIVALVIIAVGLLSNSPYTHNFGFLKSTWYLGFIGGTFGLIVAVPVAAFIWGMLGSVEDWTNTSRASTFLLTRPVSTALLARARLHASVRALGTTTGILLLLLVAYGLLFMELAGLQQMLRLDAESGHYSLANAIYSSLQEMTRVLFIEHGPLFGIALIAVYLATCWALLWGGLPLLGAAIAAMAILTGFLTADHILSASAPLRNSVTGAILVFSALGMLAALVLFLPIAFVVLARKGLRWGIVSRKALAGCLVIWLMTACAAALYVLTTSRVIPEGFLYVDIGFGGSQLPTFANPNASFRGLVTSWFPWLLPILSVAFLPTFPLLLAPWSLHRLRHR